MKITHVISGLRTGGAEGMLLKLLSLSDSSRFQSRVVSLTEGGDIGRQIAEMGIPVRTLAMKRGRSEPRALLRLAAWLRQDRPDLVQTWLYHADLLGGLAAVLAGRIPVVWNLRHSDLEPDAPRRTVWTISACARLSRWLPTRIVSCSEAGCRVHSELGYPADRMIVIPNGFDLDRFQPASEERTRVRREIGVRDDALIVGVIARYHPQKDHSTFLEAARRVAAGRSRVHFLFCGPGVDARNEALVAAIRNAGLADRCLLLGRRNDVERIHAALDVACSSSASGEGFSNAIGESMACAVPCVVTDVGDSARIVGETGRIVGRRDPAALAASLGELLDLTPDGRQSLGRAARRRIGQHYSLSSVVERYEDLYSTIGQSEAAMRAAS